MADTFPWPINQSVMGPIGTTKFALALARISAACMVAIVIVIVVGYLYLLWRPAGPVLSILIAAFLGLVAAAPPFIFHNINYLDKRRPKWVSMQRAILVLCLIFTWLAAIIIFMRVAEDVSAPISTPLHKTYERLPAWARTKQGVLAEIDGIERDRAAAAYRCLYRSAGGGYCRMWFGYWWEQHQAETYLKRFEPAQATPDTFWMLFLLPAALSGLVLTLGTFGLAGASEGYHEQMRENTPPPAPADKPGPLPPFKPLPELDVKDPVFDALQTWWDECVTMRAGNKMPIARLYPHYVSFCDQSGARPYENANAFSQKLSPILGKHDVFRDGSDVRVLVGIDLRTDGLSGKILDGMRTDA